MIQGFIACVKCFLIQEDLTGFDVLEKRDQEEFKMRIKRLIPCGILTYLLSAYLPVSIHPIAVQDFKVNSDTAEGIAQDWPDIAFDSLGNFVIVYCDKGVDGDFRQIYFQRFDSQANRLGVPVLVSDTTLRHNDSPATAMHPSGRFIITWRSGTCAPEWNHDIQVRRYDSSGNALDLWQRVDMERPDPDSVSWPRDPEIAIDTAGNFVIVWQAQEHPGHKGWAQLFNAFGERVGENFLILDLNASANPLINEFEFPRVAYNSQGYFFICWMGAISGPGGTKYHPLGRVYNHSREPITKIFPLVTPGSEWDYGGHVCVAANSRDNFVTAFGVNDTLGTYPNNAIAVRTFDTLGNALNEVTIVNDVIDLGDIWWTVRVAVDDLDGYVVLWSDSRDGRNLWAQRFNSEDEPQGKNYRINVPPNSLATPGGAGWNMLCWSLDICKNSVGFAWMDFRNYTTYGADVYARVLNLDAIGHYLPGDVILDGIVDTADVRYLINYLLIDGWGLVPDWTGDVNASGEVTVSDVVYLVNYLFKGGPPPQKPITGSE